MSTRILIGDATEQLRTMPASSVHCCVTSPPYYGLRDYGVAGQLGHEESPAEYVASMVAVFREVRRVLRDDGTLWLNLGDSYGGGGKGGGGSYAADGMTHAAGTPKRGVSKQLLGIPWRVAFALQADGWILRQDIIWHKPNPMPESVRDRCTKSHEYMFLFAKSRRYFYDADAVKEEARNWGTRDRSNMRGGTTDPKLKHHGLKGKAYEENPTRNLRSVWRISTRSYKGAHFAVFPPALIEPCIKAGTSEFGVCVGCGTPLRRVVAKTRVPRRPGTNSVKSPDPQRHVTTTITTGWESGCRCQRETCPAVVLDPFAGSGTTGQVAKSLGRDSILIELNPQYVPLIEARVGEARVAS